MLSLWLSIILQSKQVICNVEAIERTLLKVLGSARQPESFFLFLSERLCKFFSSER